MSRSCLAMDDALRRQSNASRWLDVLGYDITDTLNRVCSKPSKSEWMWHPSDRGLLSTDALVRIPTREHDMYPRWQYASDSSTEDEVQYASDSTWKYWGWSSIMSVIFNLNPYRGWSRLLKSSYTGWGFVRSQVIWGLSSRHVDEDHARSFEPLSFVSNGTAALFVEMIQNVCGQGDH